MKISEKTIQLALAALFGAEWEARKRATEYREVAGKCVDSEVAKVLIECADREDKKAEEFGAAYEELARVR